jgi:hypothetical protein
VALQCKIISQNVTKKHINTSIKWIIGDSNKEMKKIVSNARRTNEKSVRWAKEFCVKKKARTLP